VIRDMGIQLNRKRFSGLETHLFIEKNKISAVVINEGITCGDVVFYLAIVVRGKNRMILVFEVSLFPFIYIHNLNIRFNGKNNKNENRRRMRECVCDKR
jgi:hypothetical protein